MSASKVDKLIHVGLDGLYASLHRGNGIALSLQPYALSPNSAKVLSGYASCTTTMIACEVATKHENLILSETTDSLGSISSIIHDNVLL
jgi:hypothetical protein